MKQDNSISLDSHTLCNGSLTDSVVDFVGLRKVSNFTEWFTSDLSPLEHVFFGTVNSGLITSEAVFVFCFNKCCQSNIDMYA